jgi:hypothetical protein
MQDIKLTDELKQMNAYWRLLAGVVNEGLGVMADERLSPEDRLERLREKLEFAGRYLRVLPPSIRRELDADVRVQAVMADIARGGDHAPDGRSATYLVMGDDGTFHEMIIDPEEGLWPLSDAELRALFPEEGETK